MKLRFYAVTDKLVDVPGGHVVGQVPRYVGREFVPPEGGNAGAHPATKEPHECESDSDEGRRLMHICQRDRDLYPGDEATAAACGVKPVEITFDNGAWSESTIARDTEPVKEPATDG